MERAKLADKDDWQTSPNYIAKNDTCLVRISGSCDVNVTQLTCGMLVEAVEDNKDGSLRIRVIDTSKPQSEIWCNTEWRCHRFDLIPVLRDAKEFFLAIANLKDRICLAKDVQLYSELKNVKINDTVWYYPDPYGHGEKLYLAIVKYIGPVGKLGKGHYIGLDLLEHPDLNSTSINHAVQGYFTCTHSPGLFCTIDKIRVFKPDNTLTVKNADKSTVDRRDAGSNHTCGKTKSILDSDIAVLEKFTSFDDKKNNNRELGSLSKDWHQLGKPAKNYTEKYIKPMDGHNVTHSAENLAHSILVASAIQCPKNILNFYKMSAELQDIPVFVLEHKWSSDIESNIYSDVENIYDCGNVINKRNTLKKNENKKFAYSENSNNLVVGSTVKVTLNSETRTGIIRWIGPPPNIALGKLMVAVELDDEHPLGTDGTYDDIRYFYCRPHRAVFTDIEQCSYYDTTIPQSLIEDHATLVNIDNFGNMESSVIVGMVRPISVKGDLESICGKYRGIQGHHNSCYLDATLFSMFAFTSVFDNLLFRPPNEKDCAQYEEVQRVLREEIVNPLRKNLFVRADHVMKLRMLLERLSSVSGLTSEEKDPEEFLTSLVAQILNAEPFLKLSSGQEAYHYQLFVEKDDHLNLPTVQQLLEQSFLTSNVRLKEVPSCLIIQMPRFGKTFKMYQKIQPTLLLDVTDIIEDSPRQCTVCGKLAEYECKECYGQCGVGLESIAFCLPCLDKVHRHERRTSHEPKKLSVPVEFAILQEHCPVPRLYLELSAVVCIETSHYVSFVKCGSGSEAPWCFFDSMADRKGEQNGYNIPEMVPCPDFPYWLSEEGGSYLTEITDDRLLPEHAKRLLCDAYMCMYQSPDVMMYK